MSYQVTWEFTEERHPEQSALRRIRALVDLPKHGVKAGDLGGWVEKPENLQGNAWVAGNARVANNAQVFGNAQVSGNARLYDNAQVHSNAQVYGDALVYSDAYVSGDAHVYGNAQVCGDTYVYDNAQVYDNARLYDNAHVYGDALVYGDAYVSDDARVYGNASVYDNASVCGNARIGFDAKVSSAHSYITFGNIGSEQGTLTVFKTETGLGCTRGCFSGTIEEFLAASAKKHVGELEKYKGDYIAMIALAENLILRKG